MGWQFNDHSPLYLQAAEILKADILSGEYKAGERFPSVRDLAVMASVNPNTMQKALIELERAGFLRSNRTTGRVVTSDLARLSQGRDAEADTLVTHFMDGMKQLGFTKEETIQLLDKKEESYGTH
ncbi:MAG: GntR family transcriptional regulator [Eubacteriales bacterium]